jgi:hypothetical protein
VLNNRSRTVSRKGTGRLPHDGLDGWTVREWLWPDETRACRRPSRPRVAQETRLPGPPLTVDGTQRAASPGSITGTSAAVPASIRCIARCHSAETPIPSAARNAPCDAEKRAEANLNALLDFRQAAQQR